MSKVNAWLKPYAKLVIDEDKMSFFGKCIPSFINFSLLLILKITILGML